MNLHRHRLTKSPSWNMLFVTAIFHFTVGMASGQDTLGSMNVFQDNITMSGYSSGAAMAQMFQISYSSLFQGIAVFSQTFYRCGPPDGDIDEFDRFCTTLFNLTESEQYDPALVHQDIQEYLKMGIIEDPINLKDRRLYVYTGLRSALFSPRQGLNILNVYEPYIQSTAAIKIRVQDSVQLLPSNTYGGPCNESAESTYFIGNCGFSGVTEAINFILFKEENNEAFEKYEANTLANISEFDQTEFTKDLINHNMDDTGYYYVPTKCKSEMAKCFLHFYFHGCYTGREFNGTNHVQNTGLIELAERKGIIMIFPQAKSSEPNPIGCWDTFGVAGKYYATQQGPQVTALKRMLDRILGPRDAVTTTTIPEQLDTNPTNALALSQLALTFSSPEFSNTRKLKEARNARKLTYLPPPPEPSVFAPLRTKAYKLVVKRQNT